MSSKRTPNVKMISINEAMEAVDKAESKFLTILEEIKEASPHFLNIIDILSKGKFSIFFNFRELKSEVKAIINIFKKVDNKVKSLYSVKGYRSTILLNEIYSKSDKL